MLTTTFANRFTTNPVLSKQLTSQSKTQRSAQKPTDNTITTEKITTDNKAVSKAEKNAITTTNDFQYALRKKLKCTNPQNVQKNTKESHEDAAIPQENSAAHVQIKNLVVKAAIGNTEEKIQKGKSATISKQTYHSTNGKVNLNTANTSEQNSESESIKTSSSDKNPAAKDTLLPDISTEKPDNLISKTAVAENQKSTEELTANSSALKSTETADKKSNTTTSTTDNKTNPQNNQLNTDKLIPAEEKATASLKNKVSLTEVKTSQPTQNQSLQAENAESVPKKVNSTSPGEQKNQNPAKQPFEKNELTETVNEKSIPENLSPAKQPFEKNELTETVNKKSISENSENLSPAKAQTSGIETKVQTNTDAKQNTNPKTSPNESIFSANNGHWAVNRFTDQLSQPARTAADTSNNDVSASINKQIQESIQSNLTRNGGNQQITIRLNPPELGKVLIKFQEQNNQITGTLEVSKSQTRYQIQQALPEMLRNLQESGIQIKRLEVTLSDQPQQQTFKQQSLQYAQDFSGRQNSDNSSGANHNQQSSNQWLTNNENYDASTAARDMLISNNYINMLA